MQKILPGSIRLVNPARSLVSAMAKELDVLGLRSAQTKRQIDFYVSGDPTQFAQVSSQWLGFTPHVQSVSLSILEGFAIAQSV